MDQLELGKFVGETTARTDALDTRISEQGKSIRADMQVMRDEQKADVGVMRGDISSLRELVESRLGARRNGYREKALYGGAGGICVFMIEVVRHLAS